MRSCVARLLADLQGHIGVDALALDVVRIADDRGLGDLGMGDQRALDLGGAEPVPGDIDHVVDPAGDPVVPVLVAPRAVAGEIEAREGREIGLDEALVVAEHGAHLPRPRAAMQRLPSAAPSSRLPSPSTMTGSTPKNGRVAEPGFNGVAPGSGVMRMPPVSVCHQVSTIGQRSSPTCRSTTARPRG